MQLLCIIAPVFYKCKRNSRKVKNFGFSAFFRLNDEKTGNYSAKKVNFKERQRENPPVGADRGIARKRKKDYRSNRRRTSSRREGTRRTTRKGMIRATQTARTTKDQPGSQ